MEGEETDGMRRKPMKRIFVYIAVMLLLSAGAVFAGEGGNYGTQPYGPDSRSDPQTAQEGRPDPGAQKSSGPTSGGEYRPGKEPRPAEAGSSYRQEGPNNSVKSRWEIQGGGSIKMDVGRRQ
jgi:hypothetical protein